MGTELAGTSVATETCGHERPLKFKITVCEYWICVVRIVIGWGRGIGTGGWTMKVGTSEPGVRPSGCSSSRWATDYVPTSQQVRANDASG